MDYFDNVPQIDPESTFEQWQKGDVTLIDVREQSEWDLGHIDGILFVPLGQLQWRWRELDKDKKWICVCRRGNRSNYAAALLREAGYDVANMSGGMLEWKALKLPITDPGIVQEH
ncbi:MAG: rhodanese-like domain-containing protein [Chloroflexota bacterium]